jgi:hypothetical protein
MQEPTRDFEPFQCEQQNRGDGFGRDFAMASDVDLIESWRM